MSVGEYLTLILTLAIALACLTILVARLLFDNRDIQYRHDLACSWLKQQDEVIRQKDDEIARLRHEQATPQRAEHGE